MRSSLGWRLILRLATRFLAVVDVEGFVGPWRGQGSAVE